MWVCLRCQREVASPLTRLCDVDGEALHPVLTQYVAEDSALAGRVLGGRYIIERRLGEGGMGLVLLARHAFLSRRFAIKLLHPELLLVSEARERFLREARSASAVRDPHIVEVTDFGVTASGLHYLVMEYLDGCDLHELLARRGALDADLVARIGAQVCQALLVVHAQGYVHRDLKPENIWVESPDDDARAKLIDFGIVGRIAGTSEGDEARLTRTGRTVGTPHYMSPEQARGVALDGRSDLYALGCILWELTTARVAFDGDGPVEILHHQLYDAPRRPSDVRDSVPAWLDATILQCLEKQPDRRPPSAEALRELLLSGPSRSSAPTAPGGPLAIAETAPPPRPEPLATSPLPLATPRSRRRLVAWTALGLAAAVALMTTAWLSKEPVAANVAPPPQVAPRPPPPVVAVAPAAVVALFEPRLPEGEARAAERRPWDPGPVILSFAPTPKGTEVTRVDNHERIGTSPIAIAVSPETHGPSATYLLRHRGYADLEVVASHARSSTVTAKLRPLPRKPPGDFDDPGHLLPPSTGK